MKEVFLYKIAAIDSVLVIASVKKLSAIMKVKKAFYPYELMHKLIYPS